jgi:hypothetical protein
MGSSPTTSASGYSLAQQLRIAYMEACRELSDRARSEVSTYGDGYGHGGELIENARQLVSQAERVLELAVAAERGTSVSWETIGEALEVTRQTAHARFAQKVEDVLDDVLFPAREGTDGQLGWWACPDGLEDPVKTVQRLDAWATRHRERTDPERGERPVSENLQTGRNAGVDGIDAVLRLTRKLLDRNLPQGVTERAATRVLLEHKLRTFNAIAQKADRLVDDLEHARRELAWAEWDMTHCGYWTSSDGTYGRQPGDPYPPERAETLEKFSGDENKVISNYLHWQREVDSLDGRVALLSPKATTDAVEQAYQALQDLITWHREDLDARLGVQPISVAVDGLESYHFALGDRPIAELGFSAELDIEATGWFLYFIDSDALERAPDSPWEWLGDPRPLNVDAVDIDELVQIGRADGVEAMRVAAAAVINRTRSSALLVARRDLIARLADERAKASSTRARA